MIKISCNVILYRHKKLKNGKFPIYITIVKHRKTKRLSTGISCTPDQWDDELQMLNSNYKAFKRDNAIIREFYSEVLNAIKEIKYLKKEFSLNELVRKIKGNSSQDFFIYYQDKIDDMLRMGKVGNADIYSRNLRHLEKYWGKNTLHFSEINYTFLEQFEIHEKERGLKNSSISIVMRTIRAIFNRAIKEDVISRALYPFEKYEISKLKTPKRKHALTKEEVLKLWSYETDPNTTELDSKNIFILSYLMHGTSFSDLINLKWDDVCDDRFEFSRMKSKSMISVKISEQIGAILDYYKTMYPQSKYIFPILTEEDTNPHKRREKLKTKLKRVNKHLQKFATALGIEKKITSSIARNSYATILKNQGIPITMISEALGHSELKTTQIYLDSFSNTALDKMNELLL